jgi:hypothetical protein
MRTRVVLLALSALAMLSLTNASARADWGFTDDGDVFIQSDQDWPVLDLDFHCDNGVLRGKYDTLEAPDAKDVPPANKALKLAVANKNFEILGMFTVVQDDDRTFSLGAKDARSLWLLIDKGVPFKTALTDGKKTWWRGAYDSENFAELKDKLAAFCPATP